MTGAAFPWSLPTHRLSSRRFFEAVLDWRFERFPMPYEVYRIAAGPDCAEPGGLRFGLIEADAAAA
jgi:predicted enzyme related to lactoylglutathione lyase